MGNSKLYGLDKNQWAIIIFKMGVTPKTLLKAINLSHDYDCKFGGMPESSTKGYDKSSMTRAVELFFKAASDNYRGTVQC